MAEASFKQREDLEDLNPEERAEYNVRFCEHLGIPTNLGLLKYFYANNIEGRRTLILYATRGATDIIRGNRGITVDSLEQKNGEGFVSFTARAHDANGRYEMATGAAGTHELKGEKLANAVMAAQTKALRRVTLQFVGGGLLDESEIPTYDTTIPNSASLAELSKPAKTAPAASVKPNNDAGKDVTKLIETARSFPDIAPDPAIIKDWKSYPEHLVVDVKTGASEIVQTESREAFTARMEADRADATRQLNEHAAKNGTVATAEPVKRTRKPRKAVNTVSLGEDTAVKVEAPKPPPGAAERVAEVLTSQTFSAHADIAEEIKAAKVDSPIAPVQAVAAVPAQASPVVGAPNAEKLKEYRARLGKYANDILPSGGMMPSAGIGGVTMKLRNFANLQLGLSDVMRATEEQWDELLTFLDEYTTNKGAAELVKYIDAAIGVK